MIVSRRLPNALRAVALLALVAVPAHAEAQLMSRIKQAAKEKVAESVGAPAAKPAAASKSSRTQMEITPERVDAFIVAMRPVIAHAERMTAARAAQAVYDEKGKRYTECGERVGKRITMAQKQQAASPSMETQLKIGALAEASTALMEEYSKALTAGKHERAQVIEDSMTVLEYRVRVLQFPPLAECGPPPRRPAEMIASSESGSAASHIAQPAGMSATQFGLLRERIAVSLLTRGKEDPFTPAERSALDARMNELEKLTAYFRDGALEWSSWSDLGDVWNGKSASR